MKLNLGGEKSKEGWYTVNFLNKSPDIIWNLNNFPYPPDNNTIEEIYMRMTLEHLNEPVKVLNECYRILKPGGIITLIVPYGFTTQFKPFHKHNFMPQWFKSYIRIYNVNYKIIELITMRARFLKWKRTGIKIVYKKEGIFL